MDDIDQGLIGLLRQNARLNIADLAHKLGVSRGTVNNRLRKLEDSQVIVGYTVKLWPEAEPERICRYIKLDTASRRKTKICRTTDEWRDLGNPR